MPKSKTIQHRKLRVLSSLAPIFEFTILNQDITRGYIKGHSFSRDIYRLRNLRQWSSGRLNSEADFTYYVKLASEFNLPEHQYLICLRHLYRLSESGDSWFQKDNLFLTEKLNLTQSDTFMSLYYQRDTQLPGMLD